MSYGVLKLPAVVGSGGAMERIAPTFDFESGEFVFEGGGRIALCTGRGVWEDWCLKVCMTERGTRLAYSEKIGVEMENLGSLEQGRAKSQIRRTITEALRVHPKTAYVKDFRFSGEGDLLNVSFVIGGEDLSERRATVGYVI